MILFLYKMLQEETFHSGNISMHQSLTCTLNYSTDDILFFIKGDIKGKSNFSASRLLMNNVPPKIAQLSDNHILLECNCGKYKLN